MLTRTTLRTGLLFLLLPLCTLGQSGGPNIFSIKKIPVADTLLTGWVWGAGNQRLTNFDPAKDINIVPHHLGVYHMEAQLWVDSAVKQDDFTFAIRQAVASVVRLDGQVIANYGDIHGHVSAYDPLGEPFNVKLSPGKHLISVELAFDDRIPGFRTSDGTFPVFKLYISSATKIAGLPETPPRENGGYYQICLFLTGMFFILALTFFVYYGFTPKKAYLFYAIASLIGSYEYYLNAFRVFCHSPFWFQWSLWLGITSNAGTAFITLTVYALFNYRSRWFMSAYAVMAVIAEILLWTYSPAGDLIFGVVLQVSSLVEIVRVSWLYRHDPQQRSALLISGVCGFFICFTAGQLITNPAVNHLLIILANLSFPAGMAIYLGIQIALTNKTLALKLTEVNELSARNLEIQQEKQELLARQNEQLELKVAQRTQALNDSLAELKQTQHQLVQSAKMASLGELTAGIAHEIQNPLNFVNNFSEVTSELVDELEQEIEKGDEAEARSITSDIKQNLNKILSHGKRADSIVKNMLEHSRPAGGQKEQVDVNQLVEEYLRLAYHGARSKDNSLTAAITTSLNAGIPPLHIAAQDIGRVLLNILNNAFYAVREQQHRQPAGYQGEVSVTTVIEDRFVIIEIRDNGTGIPAAIKDKIMQPFFTTKPTGEGTGLGLSLSYDIIVKGYGGKLLLDSEENKGAYFQIHLPLS